MGRLTGEAAGGRYAERHVLQAATITRAQRVGGGVQLCSALNHLRSGSAVFDRITCSCGTTPLER
jgi:hypothetical protein